MGSLAPFGSASFHYAVGHNQVVIRHVVNPTETQDFEAALLMIFVDVALAARRRIFPWNQSRVVKDDPGCCDCVEERKNRCQIFVAVFF